jgi:glycosyltransferase involved in cell wall biosynthesis
MEEAESAPRLTSIVVPALNEAESLEELAGQICSVTEANALDFELIFVDDGSQDASWDVIKRLASGNRHIRGIRFRRNFGKAAALAAGFSAAQGDVVFQMDADLQDDPREIPNLLATLNKGYDVVNGWKRKRRDPWHKVLPSRIFNRLVSLLTGLRLHDHNCGLKCFRSGVVKQIHLYGELHRFIPVIAHSRGYRVAELTVQHRPRRYGHSKYGVHRFIKGFLDLMSVSFLTGFGQRPLHLLGGIGLVAFFLGGLGLSYLAFCWFLARLHVEGFGPIGHRPLLTYSLAGVVLGFQMLAIGFLAELMIALHIQSEHAYSIAEKTEPHDKAEGEDR